MARLRAQDPFVARSLDAHGKIGQHAAAISATTTFAPSRANSSAIARPMPEPAPVTTAVRPSKLRPLVISWSSLFSCESGDGVSVVQVELPVRYTELAVFASRLHHRA